MRGSEKKKKIGHCKRGKNLLGRAAPLGDEERVDAKMFPEAVLKKGQARAAARWGDGTVPEEEEGRR